MCNPFGSEPSDSDLKLFWARGGEEGRRLQFWEATWSARCQPQGGRRAGKMLAMHDSSPFPTPENRWFSMASMQAHIKHLGGPIWWNLFREDGNT